MSECMGVDATAYDEMAKDTATVYEIFSVKE